MKIYYLTFDLGIGVKATQNVAQYPLHHVNCAPAKFEEDTSIGLGEMHSQENILFDFDLGSRLQQMLSSTLYIM